MIVVDSLSKRYRIGVSRPYRTLAETVGDLWRSARFRPASEEASFIWALRDVSFEVSPGEAVGIIGRNGSGKSTLLKILSRITRPTAGRATLRGRVGSLLEVGTGFHPELTGRENVHLNGSILGMRRNQIRRRFDEIVAFAGVERFIDTPVKRYSSGMYLRLAFAVAAHLEPEILIVDEVLAVGDAQFQKRCLGKMEEVSHQGRTVLFVSHNMPAVTRLCPRTILLNEGRLVQDGPSHEVATAYLRTGLGTAAVRSWPDAAGAPGNDVVRLLGVRVLSPEGTTTAVADIRRAVGIELEFAVLRDGHRLVPNLHFFTEDGICAFVTRELGPACRVPRDRGRYVSRAWVPPNFLAEGTMIVSAAVSTMDPVTIHVFEREAVAFQVIDTADGDSARGDFGGAVPGVVRPLLTWDTSKAS